MTEKDFNKEAVESITSKLKELRSGILDVIDDCSIKGYTVKTKSDKFFIRGRSLLRSEFLLASVIEFLEEACKDD